MDNTIIEQKGVNAVEDYLNDTGVIVPYFVRNNTLPIWDGEVFVYRNQKINNSNFEFRVPVQVKAHNSRTPKIVTQSIPIVNLEKYYDDGGVVLFSVYIKNGQKDVYCAFLGRSELKKILKAGNGKQINKAVPLVKAPKEHRDLLKKLKSIDLQRKHELIDLSTLSGRTDYHINFTVDVPKGDNIYEYLATHFIDVTVAIDGIPGEFYPEGGPVSLQVSETQNCDISINNIVYYNSFLRSFKQDGLHINVGKSIELIFPIKYSPEKPFTLNIKLIADDLTEIIKELSFILALKQFRYIQFGSFILKFDELEHKRDEFDHWQKALDFWKKVEKLLTMLHVNEPLKLHGFTPNDEKDLKTLIDGFIDNELFRRKGHSEDFISVVKICNLNILVLAKHIQADKFKLMNVFEHCVSGFTDEDGRHHLTPVISYMLDVEPVLSNLRLSRVVDDYKMMEKEDSSIVIRANLDALSMINLYDKTGDIKFLTAAYDIICWLKNERTDIIGHNILLLNYYQILYRKNNGLSEEEKNILLNLENTDSQEKFACSVLLGENDRASSYFSKLPKEDQEAIKGYPIYSIYKKIK